MIVDCKLFGPSQSLFRISKHQTMVKKSWKKQGWQNKVWLLKRKETGKPVNEQPTRKVKEEKSKRGNAGNSALEEDEGAVIATKTRATERRWGGEKNGATESELCDSGWWTQKCTTECSTKNACLMRKMRRRGRWMASNERRSKTRASKQGRGEKVWIGGEEESCLSLLVRIICERLCFWFSILRMRKGGAWADKSMALLCLCVLS